EIKSRHNKYISKFGVAPTFKAGVHSGEVVAGEIRIIKRDITYSGDVLNTTARIESMCHELKSELLVSNTFLRSISLPEPFIADIAGGFLLKGKEQEVALARISMN